jgi:glycosyltransferase involved in cell wall biosynthesis
MAAGLPALATDVGDVKAMLGEESADFVVAPADEAAYAARLAGLMRDGSLRSRLGRANGERAPRFGERAMVEAFRALYAEAAFRKAAA